MFTLSGIFRFPLSELACKFLFISSSTRHLAQSPSSVPSVLPQAGLEPVSSMRYEFI